MLCELKPASGSVMPEPITLSRRRRHQRYFRIGAVWTMMLPQAGETTGINGQFPLGVSSMTSQFVHADPATVFFGRVDPEESLPPDRGSSVAFFFGTGAEVFGDLAAARHDLRGSRLVDSMARSALPSSAVTAGRPPASVVVPHAASANNTVGGALMVFHLVASSESVVAAFT